jgi:hypothetical protein
LVCEGEGEEEREEVVRRRERVQGTSYDIANSICSTGFVALSSLVCGGRGRKEGGRGRREEGREEEGRMEGREEGEEGGRMEGREKEVEGPRNLLRHSQ